MNTQRNDTDRLRDKLAELEKALMPFATGALDVSETAIIVGFPDASKALKNARKALGLS